MFDKPPLNPRSRVWGLSTMSSSSTAATRASARPGSVSTSVRAHQDIGFRNDVDILFDSRPAVDVTLRVLDENGGPTTASLVIRDAQDRVYPPRYKRLAPDFDFHPQVYRSDGERSNSRPAITLSNTHAGRNTSPNARPSK